MKPATYSIGAARDERAICKRSIFIAKLHRLSRDVHFICGLMMQKIPFIVAELGPAVDPRGRAELCWEGSHSNPHRDATSVHPTQRKRAAQAVARHLNTSHAPECAGTGSRRARWKAR